MPDSTGDAREDFRDAAARHRRSAWRVTAACRFAYLVLGLVVALGLSPLLWGLAGIAGDVVNLVVPAPDVLNWASAQLEAAAWAHSSTVHRIALAVLAALPGAAVLAVMARALRRALMQSPLYDVDCAVGRPADRTALVEMQLVHAVEEMAIAATLPAPRVAFLDGSLNGAAFGTDPSHAIVLIGTGMLRILSRAQMQAVAGHLVASIADGDLEGGLDTACTVGVFSLMQRLGWDVLRSIDDRDRFRSAFRLVRALLTPGAASAALIQSELADSFASAPRSADRSIDRRMTWREWVLMPALGPVFFNGMIGGILSSLVLSPVVNRAWRRRKYIADATCVRLTRDPGALDDALSAITAAGGAAPMPAWAAHLCIVDTRRSDRAFFNTTRVSIFPPPAERHRALMRLGADTGRDALVGQPRANTLASWFVATVSVLTAVVAVGAVGCAYCLSLIATLFPIGLLHAILRL